ncbi:LEA type 2 family protein [Myxococcus stipitatus]|uniref:LEA type 2 family protein n=1 Tax=Myxococcus stipitatus TaxID=83455 RepID=UPI0031454BF6
MMRTRRELLGLLGGGVLASGCLGSAPFHPRAYEDAVRVESLAVDFAEDKSGLLDVGLQVKNPSSDAASVSFVDFELWVDGRRVASGQQQVDAALPPHAEIPLRVLFPLAAERVVAVPGTQALPVRVRGGVLLRFGTTERRAPFRVQGSLRLTHVPPLDAGGD